MTDSMKFGPEWLRNMSSDSSGSGAGSGSNSSGSGNNTLMTTTLMPRFQQAEYRYGREEMLSLCEKDMKLPEILPNFKKLFVEKEQLPLALSPSTDDENVYQFPSRPWSLRSPVSLVPPPRIGRGGSVDRGRGRPRILSSASFPTRPPFDENIRAVGRGTDRGWPERNGGNDIGSSGDWNGSPSSSPRKEFSSHGRGTGMENWRRSRVEDDGGDGWRSTVGNSNPSSYRWSRSTSWRDEESTNPFLGGAGNAGSTGSATGMTPITRSFSSSASVGHTASNVTGNMDRNSNALSSNGPIYKSLSQGNNSHDLGNTNNSILTAMRDENSSNSVISTSVSQTSKTNAIWDQEDIPEWAMENTNEGGGSFDATGAFHVPNDEEDDGVGNYERRPSQQSCEYHPDVHKANSANGIKNSQPNENLDQRLETETKSSVSAVQEGEDLASKSPSLRKTSSSQMSISIGETKPPQTQADTSSKIGALDTVATSRTQKLESSPLPEEVPPPLGTLQTMNAAANPTLPVILPSELSVPKNTSSDLADRMQEVADDMVEKLIMEDEMTSAASPAGSSGQVPLLKSTVTSGSPTGVANHLLQRPIQVHNHPLMAPPPQPAPTPSGELWYYRDPQNKIQGPFTGTEMAEWYRSDYFDENLFVRRVCDTRFATLGELVKMCGNSMPFLSSHLIPPLQNTHVLPLNNQSSNIVPSVPPPVNISQAKPINIVNPMLNTNEMATSLNMHLQFLQKEHLLRQSLIFSKLSATEQFALLSPERQQQIQQQMTQASLPDNIVNLPASINFLYGGVNPSPFSMQQMIPGSANSIGSQKPDMNQAKLPNPHNPFVPSGGRTDFPIMPPLHNLMQSASSGQPIIQAPPPMQPQNTDDHIKAILRHLQTTKAMPPNVGNVYPQNTIPNLQRMPWMGSSGSSGGPASMWDFDPMNSNIPMAMKPEMKTEQQILEEQRQHQHQQAKQQQHQQQIQPAETQVNELQQFSTNDVSPQPKIPKHVLTQPTSPTLLQLKDQNLTVLQQPAEPHVEPQHGPAQSTKKTEEKTPKLIHSDDTNIKSSKIDEGKKPIKCNKLEKKDLSKLQKPSDEDKKREAAEERKKQKEEKKKQLIEEEKKRQQQFQEEEKRRQMLEEKKRLEDIDRHRRTKMLQNAPSRLQKQNSDSSSSRSSVAPWSNTGLPGISTPAASLAEIQKAERERRTEERLELINQRKIQQIEMLSKVEPTLTWNAPSINVKSLAEIQAEEHKQQQQIAYDQAVAAVVQRRKKDDLTNSQQSFFSAASQNTASNNTNAQTSSLGSMWYSWNGKPAWSSTSNAGFWEEPTKIPTSTSSTSGSTKQANSASTHGGNNSNRLLSKSQTFSNIHPGKSTQNQTVGTGSVSSSESRNASNQSGSSSSKPAKGGTSAKQTKGSSSNSASYSGQNATNNNKKDDARNEFISWCIKTLSTMKSTVDVPTFIQFLQDIESPYEVKDYIRIYLGETKECTEFAKQFLERRSKYKNQQRAQNAHIDDMCSPAPAINPGSNDFQEVKGKGKKVKKSKMTKLDARILGFSVTAAQDRINVGDRDYGDTA